MTIELGLIFSVISAVLGVLGYQISKANKQIKEQQMQKDAEKEKSKEVKEESHQDAKVETQLNYISRGVDDIRIDLKANEKRINEMNEKVARIDESSKQAHKRIDKLEGGVIKHG